MSVINTTLPSLRDLMSRLDPNGASATIVELMTQLHPFMEDLRWKEGNLPTGHQITQRTALPSATWRRLNEGIDPTKSTTAQVTETCGLLEAHAVVDSKLVELNGGLNYRLSEEVAFAEGMANDLETAFFYSSVATDPEKIHGMSPRLNSTTGLWGGQIIDSQIAASGADNASVWLVCHGENGVHGIYPKGSTGGFTREDKGEHPILDPNSKRYFAQMTQFTWTPGLAIVNGKAVGRLANVDTSAIAETGALFIQDLIKLCEQVDLNLGSPMLYMNRRLATYLRLQAVDRTANGTVTFDTVGGKRVMFFGDIPIRRTDALTNVEVTIT